MTTSDSPDAELIYILDPMCSWCYAFAGPMQRLLDRLGDRVAVRRVMGGLAADSEQPMPMPMREAIAATWRTIEQRTGTPFNHDFWRDNEPRRSTYPACRAVLAAGLLDPPMLPRMVAAIQHAYYREAKNPSLEPVLLDLAASIGLSRQRFAAELAGERVQQALVDDLDETRRLGIGGFPTVLARTAGTADEARYALLTAGYVDGETLLARWQKWAQSLGLAA